MQTFLKIVIVFVIFWTQTGAVYNDYPVNDIEEPYFPDEQTSNDDTTPALTENDQVKAPGDEYPADTIDTKTNEDHTPDNTQEEEEAVSNGLQEDEVNAESTCVCKKRVKAALIVALQSCINVLKTQQQCHKRKKRESEVAEIMSSCSCSDKVNKALIKSLKRCTDAIEYTAVCRPRNYTSCAAIKQANPSSPSGYYNLVINGRTVRVYCNMGLVCRYRGGWTQLRSWTSATNCPFGFSLYTVSGRRVCGRPTSSRGGCASIRIPSNGIRYSRVCGRVRGYQRFTTDGFNGGNINTFYLDGISITRGSSRQHVWSLASGYNEQRNDAYACPCNTGAPSSAGPPPYVGNNYYCESGILSGQANRFFTNDPLWDGQLCRGREGPCCPSGSLRPWFYRNMGSATADYIELRVCTNQPTNDENVGIDQYEFYVM